MWLATSPQQIDSATCNALHRGNPSFLQEIVCNASVWMCVSLLDGVGDGLEGVQCGHLGTPGHLGVWDHGVEVGREGPMDVWRYG